MTRDILWQDPTGGRMVTRVDRPSQAVVDLLGQTVWGSRATRYRIPGIAAKLARLRDPSFFVLSENGEELCVFVLDKCVKRVGVHSCGAYHFVMASTKPERQNQGLAGELIEHVRRYCRETVGAPGIGFAYVEETTEFSLRLSDQIGHSVEADIPLTLFTRVFPRPDPAVGLIRPNEKCQVLAALERSYANHQLSDFEAALRPDECFVLRNGDTVLAAAQAEMLRWSVVSMPGATGAFLLNVLPRLPGLNRMLDLRDLKIVRLGNLTLQDGHETALFRLLEACLNHYQSRIGLILLDGRSPMLRRIRDHGRLGWLSHALSGSAKMRIDVVGMDDVAVTQLRDGPVLVSAADVF
ncbi:hypothetical protein LCL97_04025 [Seohaeicola saemankumensis]|nr:hypothetical protein [Seohaeicola saemankumensis]MCA0869976.1 hypothetical protein [Seohaeicola saemankumensis]